MATEYTSAGGVGRNYGPLTTPESSGGVTSRESVRGDFHQVEVEFDFAHPIPAATLSAGALADNRFVRIPANSFITRCHLYVGTAWAGGTSIAINSLKVADGTVDTANGFVTATQGAVANLTANSWRAGTGGLVGATVGTADVIIGSATVGTFTAGTAKLVVEYLRAA